ncbi:MAG: hypothetical protein WD042_15825 [Phycisphaeraceae bacterium]
MNHRQQSRTSRTPRWRQLLALLSPAAHCNAHPVAGLLWLMATGSSVLCLFLLAFRLQGWQATGGAALVIWCSLFLGALVRLFCSDEYDLPPASRRKEKSDRR